MTIGHKRLLYTALAIGAIYIATLSFTPYPGHFAVKAIPAIALAVLALLGLRGLPGKLLFTALLFCAAGDVALALEGDQFFVIGLAFFLVAQVFFIATFARSLKRRKSRLPVVIALVAYAAAMSAVLKPHLGEFMVPVFVYVAVITTMGIFAALRAQEGKLVLYGAVSFIISDSLIAVDRFAAGVPAAGYLIMITYYLALFLIVCGCVRDDRTLDSPGTHARG